jgi:hypothetical protein
MGSVSRVHGLIAGNLFSTIRPKAREKQCQLFIADMKGAPENIRSGYFLLS